MDTIERAKQLIDLGNNLGIDTSALEEFVSSSANKPSFETLSKWNSLVKQINAIRGDVDEYEGLLNQLQNLINEDPRLEDKQPEITQAYNNLESWREYNRLRSQLEDTRDPDELETIINRMRELLESSGRESDDFDRAVTAVLEARKNRYIETINQYIQDYNQSYNIDEQIELLTSINTLAKQHEIELDFDPSKEIEHLTKVKEYMAEYEKLRQEVEREYL